MLKEHDIGLHEQNCGCSDQCPLGKGLLRGRTQFKVGGTWVCHGGDLLGPQRGCLTSVITLGAVTVQVQDALLPSLYYQIALKEGSFPCHPHFNRSYLGNGLAHVLGYIVFPPHLHGSELLSFTVFPSQTSLTMRYLLSGRGVAVTTAVPHCMLSVTFLHQPCAPCCPVIATLP